MQSIMSLEKTLGSKLTKNDPILVTGASGGVGSTAVAILGRYTFPFRRDNPSNRSEHKPTWAMLMSSPVQEIQMRIENGLSQLVQMKLLVELISARGR